MSWWWLAVLVCCVQGCHISEFRCRNGRCVRLDQYCNTVDDCGDMSDEPRTCTGTPCNCFKFSKTCKQLILLTDPPLLLKFEGLF